MDLAAYFFKEIVGVYKFKTPREEALTRCTIAYLQESGVSTAEIFQLLNEVGNTKGYLEPADIPDWIWEKSLTKKGHYYCHHALQLVSPTPIIRRDGTFKEYPFYQEMRIRFTLDDLIEYFYAAIPGYMILRDKGRDERQFKHLLRKYSNLQGIEELDFVLCLIDEAAYQKVPVIEPFNIDTPSMQTQAANKLTKTLAERHAKGYDKNIWRTYLIEQGEMIWQTKEM